LVPLLAAGLLVGTTACGGDDGEAATTTSALTTRDLQPLSPMQVELIDPGEEPRQEMVHEFSPGATWDGGIEFGLEADGVISARAFGDSTLSVQEVDDDGNALVHYTLDALDVALATGTASAGNTVPDALSVASDVLIQPDRAGVSATTPQVAASGSVPGAEGLADSLDPRLVFLLFPFPSEPVGRGARWTVHGSIALLGSPVDLAGEVRMTRHQGAAFTIEVEITISPTEAAAAPVQLDLAGLGRVSGDLHQIGPKRSSMIVTGTAVIQDRGPTPQPMSLSLDLDQRHSDNAGG
jgi:hypothetical protein